MTDNYVPKHRNAPKRRVRTGAKNAVYASGAAFFATGLSVTAGIAGNHPSPDSTLVNFAAGETTLTEADLADREQSASRSTQDRRGTEDAVKAANLDAGAGVAVTKSLDLSTADPRNLARALLGQFGFDGGQFACLDPLWEGESGWRVHAANPYSSAYGIPQALPGSKMASAGADWQDSAETQIRWGLGYIKNRYGTPCSAWSFKQGHGWY